MQKKLIALAIAGLSGAAFAQSNVTISGAIEAHFESISSSGATAAGTSLTSRTRVTDNTSWLRLSGSEKIGDLTALFQVETDLNIDSNAGQAFGNRNSYVGLAGGFGAVVMGHHDAHYTSHMEGGVDWGSSGALPHAANTMNLVSQITGMPAAAGNLIGGRLSNVVAYLSPNFNGLTARLAYSTGAAASEDTTAAVAKDNAYNLFVKYANGPINAFWSNVGTKNGNGAVAIATVDAKADRLGAAYTMPNGLKIGLVYDNSKVTIAGATLLKRTAWSLPISYTSGANGFYFAYAKAGNTSAAAGTNADTGATNTILGYTYSLSKRTQLGASWSRITNQANAAYNFWARGTSVATPAGADPTSFAVGINHAF